MHDFGIAVTPVDAIENAIYLLFAGAFKTVPTGLAAGSGILQTGNTHAQQAYRRGPMAFAPVLEKRPGHTVKRARAVGTGSQAAAARHGVKSTVPDFYDDGMRHQVLCPEAP